MRIGFTVRYTDGREVTAKAGPLDVIEFERRYGVAYASLGDAKQPAREEWWYFLAWSPLHRAGQEPRQLEEFLGSVDAIDLEIEADAPVPTKRGRSGAKSPASQSQPA